jgi:ABC-type enterochelin transport system substrate-binding protein
MENAIVKQTDAYKNGRIVYLTPDVWYLPKDPLAQGFRYVVNFPL